MTLTEDEAREKWCPQVRFVPGAASPYAGNRCVASDCMAWRWDNAPGPRPHGAPEERFTGHCGLAGKP